MFKELLLTICIGIIVGFILFLRTQHALKEAYSHHIRAKYATNCHTALKYPQLNDDDPQHIHERDSNIEHKFYKPPLYTDPLFNPKSTATQQLRSEFSQLFAVLDTMRDFIIRDFIDFWYKTAISPDDTKFINHIKCTIDGAFQTLVKRISSTNWTYFTRDRIFHPLRECLILYRNIIRDLSKKNPKWNELTETERDHFIAGMIEQRYQWHRGCDSPKASIEYLRKWSLLFVEEVLDERNFHCFAVRFFCRELLTNNILYPIIQLVDGYNVNFGIVSAFMYLTQNADQIKNDPATHRNDEDASVDPSHEDGTIHESNPHTPPSEEIHTTETISTPDAHIESNVSETNSEQKKENNIQRVRMGHTQKRKRRASLDTNVMNHYHKSFKINYFFIEINGDQSPLLQLTPFIERSGYDLSCKYDIESQYKFTIRFVSTQCIDLCARYVQLMGDTQILSEHSSLKELKRIEYDDHKFIYMWSDHKLHEFGDSYLQLGRQMMVSSDIQRHNKFHHMRYVFVPLNIPLLHIYFKSSIRSGAPRVPPIPIISSTVTATPHTPPHSAAIESTNSSISEGLAKFGNAINPLNVIDNIGDGIKKLLPHTITPHHHSLPNKIYISPTRSDKGGKRTLFGHYKHKKKKKEHHGFHHRLEAIGYIKSHKKNGKTDDPNDDTLKRLAQHKPTRNLTIRICDAYRDFDAKMNPYVAYILRMRDVANPIGDELSTNGERIEWTLKTRYSKLHSFHRAIQRDKSLKSKRIKSVAQFPPKSLITKMDTKNMKERKKQLMAYLSTLHRYPDVLLCDTVYQLVIPPVLVQKYQSNKPPIETTRSTPVTTPPHVIKTKDNDSFYNLQSAHVTHPVLPSQQTPHHVIKRKESSPDLSIPMVVGGECAIVPFSDEYEEEMDDEKVAMVRSRPRRGSDCGITVQDTYNNNNNTYLQRKISVIDLTEDHEPKYKVSTIDMAAMEEAAADSDDHVSEMKEDDVILMNNNNNGAIGESLERFRIEHYEHITPSLIRVLESFLDLEKRSTFGSSLTLAATSMMSWFFNGYIANKLYAQSASLTMDGTLSYLVQWISDLLWIPPSYEMSEEEPPIPSQEEMDALRVEARRCIQEMFEEFVGDNVPKIIGQRKQLERCMMKFWRFMQQNKLLKHLAFSVLDALLQDLFVEKVSRRYQRRAWIVARRNRKKEERQNKNKRRQQQLHQRGKHQPSPIRTKSQGILLNGKQKINVVAHASCKPPQIGKREQRKMMNNNNNKIGEIIIEKVEEEPQLPRPQSIPLFKNKKEMNINAEAPNIDIFSGGSLLSDYTKKFMKLKHTKSASSSDDDDEEESTESEDDNNDEETVWNHGFTYYSDDDAHANKLKYKQPLQNGGSGFFRKFTGNKDPNKKKDGVIKPEYFMH